MSVVTGLLLAVGVLVAAGPRGRPVAPCGGGRSRGAGAARPVGAADSADPPAPAGTRADDLAGTVTTVCSLLHAGARPSDAWAQALRLPACGTVPTLDQLVAGPARGRRRSPTVGELGRARAVVAAAAVAHRLGAPLAAVLEEVVAAVVADAEAEAELAAALAGPRTSVRVLLGLPALGVLLGTALGADPLAVLLDGGPGTVCGLLGCGLVLAGWCWTRALVARARRAAAS